MDYANVFRIATESSCPGVRNFTARNIEVIHFPDRIPVQVFYLHPTGQMPMENLTFENIHINGEYPLNLIKITPIQPLVGTRPIEIPKPNSIETGSGRRGNGGRDYGEFIAIPAAGPYIHNVVFKNIDVYGAKKSGGLINIRGVSNEHDVANILFNNVTVYGDTLKTNSPNMKIGDFVQGVLFK